MDGWMDGWRMKYLFIVFADVVKIKLKFIFMAHLQQQKLTEELSSPGN